MSLPKALCLLSGGMDSAVTSFIASQEFELTTIFFKYGQPTQEKELWCFEQLSARLNAKKIVVELPFYRKLGGSALTDDDLMIPQNEEDGIPNTYVPFRNGTMLAIAAAHAEVLDIENIFIGAVWEDSSAYPDCRDEFLKSMENAINLGTGADFNLKIHYPVINMKKSEIIQKGQELCVPFEFTWSCYGSVQNPCGKCPSCRLRQKAFKDIGLIDPAIYQRKTNEI